MVRTNKNERVEKERALYDGKTVQRLVEKYGPASEIKRHIDTTATVYEIRAATWYWVFDKGCPRRSKRSTASARVWKMAKAVDEGRTEVQFT